MIKRILVTLLMLPLCFFTLFAASDSSIKVAIDVNSAYQAIITTTAYGGYPNYSTLDDITSMNGVVNLEEAVEIVPEKNIDFFYYIISNDDQLLNSINLKTTFAPLKSGSNIIPYRIWCDTSLSDQNYLVGVENPLNCWNYSQAPADVSVAVSQYKQNTVVEKSTLHFNKFHFAVNVPNSYVTSAAGGKYIASISLEIIVDA